MEVILYPSDLRSLFRLLTDLLPSFEVCRYVRGGTCEVLTLSAGNRHRLPLLLWSTGRGCDHPADERAPTECDRKGGRANTVFRVQTASFGHYGKFGRTLLTRYPSLLSCC